MNKIEVVIDGVTYTVLSDEDPQYVHQSAKIVDRGIEEIKGLSGYSSLSAAVLTAMNIADKYNKETQISDSLRSQLQEYADECSKLRSELNRRKKQNFSEDI